MKPCVICGKFFSPDKDSYTVCFDCWDGGEVPGGPESAAFCRALYILWTNTNEAMKKCASDSAAGPDIAADIVLSMDAGCLKNWLTKSPLYDKLTEALTLER